MMYEKIITYENGKFSDTAEYYKQLKTDAASRQTHRWIMQLFFSFESTRTGN